MFRKALFVSVLLYTFISVQANAADVCQYFLSIPIDNGKCKETGLNTVVGGGFPTFADAFNLNPASIPVVKTPVGVEGIYSFTGSSSSTDEHLNVSMIKGFDSLGFAASSNSDNTFFTSNILQSMNSSSNYKPLVDQILKNSPSRPSYNFGSALGLPFGFLEKIMKPTIGASIRYNRLSQSWDTSYGFSFNSEVIAFGYSDTKADGGGLPSADTTTIDVSVKVPYFRVEYAHLKYNSSFYSQKTQILSATLKAKDLLLTAAARRYINIESQTIDETFASIQYRLSKKVALGAMYNYVPNTSSINAQFFF